MNPLSKRCLALCGRSVAILAAGVVAGTVALAAVYSLPEAPMRKNAREAMKLYGTEGARPMWSGQSRATWLYTRMDNHSEIIMVQIASAPRTGSALRCSMLNERLTGRDNVVSNFLASVNDKEAPRMHRQQYARYWHGYLVALKPLLLFWSPQQIRVANASFVLLCFCIACLAAKSRFGTAGLVAFFPAALVLNPVSAGLSLQYTACFAVATLAFSFVCFRFDWLYRKDRLALFFLSVGIAVAFFDLLAFPLATWGIPFVAALLAARPKRFSELAALGMKSSFWGLGYAGMWVSKWILGTLVTGTNVVKDAVEQTEYRMTGETWAGKIDWARAVRENLHAIDRTPVPAILVLALVVLVAMALLSRKRADWAHWPCVLGLALAACTPFLWFFALQNHSFVHPFMASKTLSVSAFALLAIPLALCGRPPTE